MNSQSQSSMSIEETNRQRIALGLAPLVSNQKAAVPTNTNVDDDEIERRRVEEIRAELAARRTKRILDSKLNGPSLGTELSSATAGSAKAWVQRQKQMQEIEKKKQQEREEQAKKEKQNELQVT